MNEATKKIMEKLFEISTSAIGVPEYRADAKNLKELENDFSYLGEDFLKIIDTLEKCGYIEFCYGGAGIFATPEGVKAYLGK